MVPEQLLEKLRSKGVRFWVEDSRLHCSVPGGCDLHAACDEIEQNQDALLSLVRQEKPVSSDRQTPAPQPANHAAQKDERRDLPDDIFMS
jgi:hypothetical protein